ncbi:MAG: hypothetical protein ACYDCK_01375 [Thermoplasmatota archaeon]
MTTLAPSPGDGLVDAAAVERIVTARAASSMASRAYWDAKHEANVKWRKRRAEIAKQHVIAAGLERDVAEHRAALSDAKRVAEAKRKESAAELARDIAAAKTRHETRLVGIQGHVKAMQLNAENAEQRHRSAASVVSRALDAAIKAERPAFFAHVLPLKKTSEEAHEAAFGSEWDSLSPATKRAIWEEEKRRAEREAKP